MERAGIAPRSATPRIFRQAQAQAPTSRRLHVAERGCCPRHRSAFPGAGRRDFPNWMWRPARRRGDHPSPGSWAGRRTGDSPGSKRGSTSRPGAPRRGAPRRAPCPWTRNPDRIASRGQRIRRERSGLREQESGAPLSSSTRKATTMNEPSDGTHTSRQPSPVPSADSPGARATHYRKQRAQMSPVSPT